jgi:hypothetical protein
MFKKILIGFAAVAIACALACSGYEFGQYLAHKEKAAATRVSAAELAQG